MAVLDSDEIDWPMAMEQCGDDEEFLRELLSDLRHEIDTQWHKIDAAVEKAEGISFMDIKRSAHVIKGASSNLMCEPLRNAAADLEKAASLGYDAHKSKSNMERTEDLDLDPEWKNVKELVPVLRKATVNYHEFLKSISVFDGKESQALRTFEEIVTFSVVQFLFRTHHAHDTVEVSQEEISFVEGRNAE
eukprot:scaffold7912_cov49-Attheya_sp.AAC.5